MKKGKQPRCPNCDASVGSPIHQRRCLGYSDLDERASQIEEQGKASFREDLVVAVKNLVRGPGLQLGHAGCGRCGGFVYEEPDRIVCAMCGHSAWKDNGVLSPLGSLVVRRLNAAGTI